MEYLEEFNLAREPFSLSPDPDMFHRSESRLECLSQLKVAIRLRRGASVVIGGVGSGKTTLCRVLVRELARLGGIDTCLVLSADFADRTEFLLHLASCLGMADEIAGEDAEGMTGRIVSELRSRFEAVNRTMCLIVDEGQAMSGPCGEALEELAALEAGDGKLIQLVIFAQNEFLGLLQARPVLSGLVDTVHVLGPLHLPETKAMIETRLELAALPGLPRPRFTLPAILYLHFKGGGYPRQIVRLCHRALMSRAGSKSRSIPLSAVMHSARAQLFRPKAGPNPAKWAAMAGAVLLAGGWLAYGLLGGPVQDQGNAPPPPTALAPAGPWGAPDAQGRPDGRVIARTGETAPPSLWPGEPPARSAFGAANTQGQGELDLDAAPLPPPAAGPAWTPKPGETEKAAAEKRDAQKAENSLTEKKAAEKAAQDKAETERLLAEKRAAEESAAAAQAVAEKAQAERLLAERKAGEEKVAAERAAAEKAEAEKRLDEQKTAAERMEAEKIAAEQKAAEEKAATAKAAAEKAEAERLLTEQKAVAKQAEADKLMAERQAAEEKFAAERAAAQQAEAERLLAEHKAAAEKAEAEKRLAEQKAAEAFASAERAAEEKLATERAEAERVLAEQRTAVEKAAAEKAEAARLLAERKAAEEMAAAARAAEEKLAAERAENERILAEQRAAAEKAEAERRLAEQRAAKEKAAAEKAETERLLAEQKVAEEKAAAERAAEEKLAAERAEKERILAEQRAAEERAAAEKAAAEKAEAERLLAEQKAAEEKVAAERAAAEKLAAERAEAERRLAEQREAEEKAAAERAAQERAVAEKAAAEKAEAERLLAERKAAEEKATLEKAEAERLLAERQAAEQKAAAEKAEAERLLAEHKAAEEKAAAIKASLAQGPALLGQTRLKAGWSFARRLEDVYGRRNKQVFDALAKANPALGSVFDAGPGALVSFPAVPCDGPPEGMALISLARAESLANALDMIVTKSTPQLPLRLFASFSPGEGLRLDVVPQRLYPDPQTAMLAKDGLPADLAGQAKVLCGFGPDTIFYSQLPATALQPGAAPKAQDQPQPTQPTQPAALGQAALKPGWALWRRIDDLYGRRGKEVFDALVQANPGLPRVVEAKPGSVINYPPMPCPPPPPGTAFVSLGETASLAEAFERVTTATTSQLPLRLLASQAPNQAPHFAIVLAKTFPNAEAAGKAIAALPPDLAQQAAILDSFAPDTVFHSSATAQTQSQAPAKPAAATPKPASDNQPAPPGPDRPAKPFTPGGGM